MGHRYTRWLILLPMFMVCPHRVFCTEYPQEHGHCIPGGTQLWVMRHVPPKRPYFFRSLSPKDPHFYQLSPNDPLFFENVEKFLAILALKAPIFEAFHRKTPYFCALCHSKTPFFDAICHRKTPTCEVLGGTCTSLSYVSAPPDCILSFGVENVKFDHTFLEPLAQY